MGACAAKPQLGVDDMAENGVAQRTSQFEPAFLAHDSRSGTSDADESFWLEFDAEADASIVAIRHELDAANEKATRVFKQVANCVQVAHEGLHSQVTALAGELRQDNAALLRRLRDRLLERPDSAGSTVGGNAAGAGNATGPPSPPMAIYPHLPGLRTEPTVLFPQAGDQDKRQRTEPGALLFAKDPMESCQDATRAGHKRGDAIEVFPAPSSPTNMEAPTKESFNLQGSKESRESKKSRLTIKNDQPKMKDLSEATSGDVQKQVFPSVEALKDKVRVALLKPQYDVREFYKTRGCAQAIARNPGFETLTMIMVAINSVWIAIDLDYNKAAVLSEANLIFQCAEHVFTAFFLTELCLRFSAFQRSADALKDTWMVFDLVLVSIMVVETWLMTAIAAIATGGSSGGAGTMDTSVLKIFKLVRLTKMARMARLLRWMPEILVLLKGLWMASKSVFCTLLLLVLTIYVFALLFMQLAEDSDIGEQYFRTVPDSMASLLLQGTLPDLSDWVREVGAEHILFAALLLLYILFASLVVMNMLVGVLVEVVAMVSTMENESMMVNCVRKKMMEMIETLNLDRDGNGTISKEEFETLLIHPDAAQFMAGVGVDVVGLVEFSEFIFKDREQTFAEFVELILQLRGSNQATVKDIVDLRKQIMQELDVLNMNQMLANDAIGTPKLHHSSHHIS